MKKLCTNNPVKRFEIVISMSAGGILGSLAVAYLSNENDKEVVDLTGDSDIDCDSTSQMAEFCVLPKEEEDLSKVSPEDPEVGWSRDQVIRDLSASVERYIDYNLLTHKNMFADDVFDMLSYLKDHAVFPECARNTGVATFSMKPGRVYLKFAMNSGPRKGGCNMKIQKGIRKGKFCNGIPYKGTKCRYHYRKYRHKHNLC